MKANKTQQLNQSDLAAFNDNFFKAGLILSGMIPLAVYIAGLAPTVTFEDSGELITAAYLWGIAHEPGYPLFTILGKLFSFLPIESVAWRINLMSAVFSSAGIIFLYCSCVLWLRELKASLISITALITVLCVGMSPAYFSQSVITEVYGLNNFFTGFLLWILFQWRLARINNLTSTNKYYYAFCFLSGLTVTNHHTAMIFIPFGIFVIWSVDPKFLLNTRKVLIGTILVMAGLLPYLYLPIASSFNPLMDWGDPDNWTNFWRVVSRHQYGLDITKPRTLPVLLSQIGLHYRILFEQFGIVWMALGGVGLITLFFRKRKLFYLSLVFNVLTGPLVAYLTNVDVTIRDTFAVAEQKALVSVMYLPFHMWWGLLMATGLGSIVQWAIQKNFNRNLRHAWFGILVAILIFFGYSTFKKESMHEYYFTEKYKDNLLHTIESNSIVIGNWDPFVFPMMYYQHVENEAKDIVFIDVELLRRSWYIRMLQRWYPAFMQRSQAPVSEFLDAVAPFEKGEKFNPMFIQQKYIAMINSFIDRNFDERPVYLTIYSPIRPLESGIATNYKREPYFVGYRLRKELNHLVTEIPESVDVNFFIHSKTSPDRMADMIRNYYSILLAERAMIFEADNPVHALTLYERSLELVESELIRNNIYARYQNVLTHSRQN